jgi:FKBP-type peptidyl-prolyl cis-trans isomerase FklB
MAITSGLAAGVHAAEAPLDLNDPTAKINYSVGYQIGSDFQRQQMELRPDAVVQGIRDAIAGTGAQMSPEEMKAAMADLGKRVVEQKRQQRETAAQQYLKEGKVFLTENAKKEGVQTTASGLQYKVLTEGSGPMPQATDTVTVNYRGSFIDGREFDSTYRSGQPKTFRVDAVIPGWTEALQMMKVGSKWELFLPPALAYGEKGMLADRALIFEMELLSIEPSATAAPEATAPEATPPK